MNSNSSEPVSLYSTWWIKPGHEEALIPAFQKLAADVLEKEPGTLMYLVHYPRYDFPKVPENEIPVASEPKVRPGTVVFVERYADWKAFRVHLNGPIFSDFVAQHKSKFVLGEDGFAFTQVVFMEQKAGFATRS